MKTSGILYSKEELEQRIAQIGKEITKDYKDKNLVLLCVLKGAFMVFSDLAKCIDLDAEMEFITLSSYEFTKSSGKVTLKGEFNIDFEGKDILIVEDILDTGNTLSFLKDFLKDKASSVKIFSLFTKDKSDLKLDYTGFKIADEFIVGYGLDCDQKYRNLPYVAILEEA